MKTKSNQSLVKTILVGILLQLITLNISIGQSKAEQINKLMSRYSEYGQFNGSVLVAEHGKVIYKKGFGMANMEWEIPNQPDTKHRLGSVTKQFTAMLILQLVEQGKLKLEEPITTYLPNYPKENGNRITIHNLLSHTSGIPNYTSFPNFMKDMSREPYATEAFVKKFDALPLEFAPGEKFAYSNSGYFLLGYIIEKVTGKNYEQNLQDGILTPLKMTNTGFDHHETILKKRASGYEKNGDGYVNADYLDMSIPHAAGSLYSTVEDLYLWDQALYTTKLLSAKYEDLLFSPHISTGRGFYGYGWMVNDISNGTTTDKLHIIEHSGGINGFNTVISRIPSDKNLVILLNNTGGADLNAMNKAIRSILYNTPYELPKKSMAAVLLSVFKEQGVEKGIAKANELKKSNEYALIEDQMNSVGYQLLQSGKVKESIEIFRMNVAQFPNSGNTYDSLGEAYLAAGNKELAITNYKKAVEIDPSNENGKKVLEGLLKN